MQEDGRSRTVDGYSEEYDRWIHSKPLDIQRAQPGLSSSDLYHIKKFPIHHTLSIISINKQSEALKI